MVTLRPRSFTPVDVAISLAAAILGLLLAFETDREYMAVHRHWLVRFTTHSVWMPDGVRNHRIDIIRSIYAVNSILCGLGLGIAVVSVRPRVGTVRRGRLRAGHVAAILSTLLTLFVVVVHGYRRGMAPAAPRVAPGQPQFTGLFLEMSGVWYRLQPMCSWSILGVWLVLAISGGWGRPVDRADRLGRWIGWAWIALLPWEILVNALVWG